MNAFQYNNQNTEDDDPEQDQVENLSPSCIGSKNDQQQLVPEFASFFHGGLFFGIKSLGHTTKIQKAGIREKGN